MKISAVLKKGKPRKSGKYLCFIQREYSWDIEILEYSNKYKMFNCSDSFDEETANNLQIDVDQWCAVDKVVFE